MLVVRGVVVPTRALRALQVDLQVHDGRMLALDGGRRGSGLDHNALLGDRLGLGYARPKSEGAKHGVMALALLAAAALAAAAPPAPPDELALLSSLRCGSLCGKELAGTTKWLPAARSLAA